MKQIQSILDQFEEKPHLVVDVIAVDGINQQKAFSDKSAKEVDRELIDSAIDSFGPDKLLIIASTKASGKKREWKRWDVPVNEMLQLSGPQNLAMQENAFQPEVEIVPPHHQDERFLKYINREQKETINELKHENKELKSEKKQLEREMFKLERENAIKDDKHDLELLRSESERSNSLQGIAETALQNPTVIELLAGFAAKRLNPNGSSEGQALAGPAIEGEHSELISQVLSELGSALAQINDEEAITKLYGAISVLMQQPDLIEKLIASNK